jgi:hypothetical protein
VDPAEALPRPPSSRAPRSGASRCPVRLTPAHVRGALALILLVAALGAFHAVPGVIGTFNDDGIYVATGWSLAHGGGYAHASLPRALPQTKYPPGLPLLLAAIWWLQPDFPGNAPLLQGVCLLAFALGVGVSFLYLVRFGYGPPAAAFAGMLLAASSSVLLYYAALPLAEGPFVLALAAALWSLEAAGEPTGKGGGRAFLAGLLVAVALLVKILAIALVPVALLFLARSGCRRLAPFLAGLLPPAAAWVIWVSHERAGAAGVLAYYVDYRLDWIDVSARELPRVLASNAGTLVQGIGLSLAPGGVFALQPLAASAGYLLFVGGLLVLWRACTGPARNRPLCWFLLFYCAACIVHPWPPGRFVAALCPLLAGLVLRAEPLPVAANAALRARLGLLPLALVLALNVGLVVLNAQRQRAAGYPALPFVHPLPDWGTYTESFAWLKANTAGSDVVAAGLDSMLWLYAGRKSYRPFVVRPLELYYAGKEAVRADPDELLRRLREQDARYLLDAPLPGFQVERAFRSSVRTLAGRAHPPLQPVFTSRDGSAVIYRVDALVAPGL